MKSASTEHYRDISSGLTKWERSLKGEHAKALRAGARSQPASVAAGTGHEGGTPYGHLLLLAHCVRLRISGAMRLGIY